VIYFKKRVKRRSVMNLHEEIAEVAYQLYMKGGYVPGRDEQNWLDAERIVLTRHASQDIEEPEGEDPMIADSVMVDEISEKPPVRARRKTGKGVYDMADIEVRRPFPGTKEDLEMRTEKTGPPRKAARKSRKK
jgi:hypothetical protein